MTEIPSPPDISDDEAVLRMFGNPPGHKFYGNDRTPDSIPPSRGWLSTIRSDLPTTFRVVDTIWPSLTSAINTYIEVSATEADVDGPLGHLSAIIERLAGSFSGQRLGSTGPDLDRDVMSPVNEAIHEIHASRHPGQEAHGPPASLLWWGDLSPQARVLPAPPTFSLRKSTCSEHGPVLATAEILSYDFLPIGLIDRIDSCLAHPSTFVDDEGLVQCKLGSCVVAGAVISRTCSPWGILSDTKHWWIFKANYENGGSVDVQRIDWLEGGHVNPWSVFFGIGVYNHDSIRRPVPVGHTDFAAIETLGCQNVYIRFNDSCGEPRIRHNARSIMSSLHVQGPLDPMQRDTIDKSLGRTEIPPSVEIHSHIESSHTWDTFRGTLTPDNSPPIKVVVKITTPEHRWNDSWNEDRAKGRKSFSNDLGYLRRIEADVVATSHLDRVLPGVGPRWYGLFGARVDSRDVWVVIVEDVGLSMPLEDLPADCIPHIDEIYRRLYNAGMAHGSVALKHVCWRMDREGVDRIRLIDFERLQYREDLTSPSEEDPWHDKGSWGTLGPWREVLFIERNKVDGLCIKRERVPL